MKIALCKLIFEKGVHVPRLATLFCKQREMGSIPMASTEYAFAGIQIWHFAKVFARRRH